MNRTAGVAAWLALGALVVAGGCGSKGESTAEAKPAAINGGPDGPSATVEKAPAQAAAVDLKHPEVVIDTSVGSITVRLDGEKAPQTVQNFLAYVEQGFYDNTIVHQVLTKYVALAGGYTPQGVLKPARSWIRNEAANGRKNLRGTVAMARDASRIDSSTSQFFFNLSDNPQLDHRPAGNNLPKAEDYGYCVFGDVTQGLDVLERVSEVPVEKRKGELEMTPTQPIVIRSVRRVR